MKTLTDAELWQLRAMIQRVGWGEFLKQIKEMLAEQLDVLASTDEDAIVGSPNQRLGLACVRSMHLAAHLLQAMPVDYRKNIIPVPEEYRNLIAANPPAI